jgi:uncharacterized protein
MGTRTISLDIGRASAAVADRRSRSVWILGLDISRRRFVMPRFHETDTTQMTSNKRTVESYMDGFRRTDRRQILSCLTDDVEWEIPGAFHVRGKQAFDTHIVDDGFVANPEIIVTRMTEEDDVVVAEGSVRTVKRDSAVLTLAFCDIFEMHHGKIRRLVSYLVTIN